MSNTIELLERIGQDASLRHSSRENLTQALNALNASEGLKLAASSGDKSRLGEELGHNHHPVRVNHNDGGCDPCEDDTENEPKHDGDEADKARPPSGK
ncbi:hypothetical protein [Rhodanobacter aciditrophus]|uniref:hypothetical protein n=1 Tax=Rhodanobacter aciditrophus TaxID=1623218 RepID=UPI003CF69A07